MNDIKLQHREPCRHFEYDTPLVYSLPFYFNPRGVLVHRVKSGHSWLGWKGKVRTGVDYWCGNGNSNGDFIDAPDDVDRLLCERCEREAALHGEPSADELTGHHVHVGRCRPFRTCCPDEEN